MDAGTRRKVVIGVAGALLVVGVLWLIVGGRGSELREVGGQSKEVQEAMQVLEAIARDPESVADHMSTDATAGAQGMVGDVARRMAEAESLQFESAGWWGGYLRVRVSWPRPGAEPLARTFFFKKEDGRLRVTGLQL